jgi:hypothetical protein
MITLHKLLGTIFRSQIDQLKIAFASASAPFHAEIRRIEKAIADFQIEVDAGRATREQITGDPDQDDYGGDLAGRRDDATDTLLTLRKAFTFLIYHHWERSSQRWAKSDKPNHKDLVKAANEAGISLEESGLEKLRLLVNTLKHNSLSDGPKLYELYPGLFAPAFDPKADNPHTKRPYTVIDWADRIELTDMDIDNFFEIVSNSLPR